MPPPLRQDVILVKGHVYRLFDLDGGGFQDLRFVMRKGPGYPGNDATLPGVTLQKVIRACHNRIGYVHGQVPHPVNPLVRLLLRWSLWLLEFRAARRRGHTYLHSPWFAANSPTCMVCGHTDCRKIH